MNYARWNFESSESGVTVCKDTHEKGQPCEYEELTPFELVEIIENLIAQKPSLLSELEEVECLGELSKLLRQHGRYKK